MNPKVYRIMRFVPLLSYAAGLLLMVVTISWDAVWMFALVTSPFTLGAPLMTIMIGHRPRRTRTYWIGAGVGLLGVCVVLGFAALMAVFWTSLGLNNNGDVDVTPAQAMPMLLMVFKEDMRNIWPMALGSITATVWMILCAVTAKKVDPPKE